MSMNIRFKVIRPVLFLDRDKTRDAFFYLFFLKQIFAVNLTKPSDRGHAAQNEIKSLKETNGGSKLCVG